MTYQPTTNIRGGETGAKNSGVLSADTLVKTGPAKVFWLSVYGTLDTTFELNDSTDNSGTDIWGMSIDISVKDHDHFIFDPPLEFEKGIYLDVANTSTFVYINYL